MRDIGHGHKTKTPKLPATWPGLPHVHRQPRFEPVFDGRRFADTVRIHRPAEAATGASFDGVTAALKSQLPMFTRRLLCGERMVFDVASGTSGCAARSTDAWERSNWVRLNGKVRTGIAPEATATPPGPDPARDQGGGSGQVDRMARFCGLVCFSRPFGRSLPNFALSHREHFAAFVLASVILLIIPRPDDHHGHQPRRWRMAGKVAFAKREWAADFGDLSMRPRCRLPAPGRAAGRAASLFQALKNL